MLTKFNVFYPHGQQLIEKLLFALDRMGILVVPDSSSEYGILILENSSENMLQQWRSHMGALAKVYALHKLDPGKGHLESFKQETALLIRKDKGLLRIHQHWERWNPSEVVETLKGLGLRLSPTPLAVLSEAVEKEMEDYIETFIKTVGPIMKAGDAEKISSRIRKDQKFEFTLTYLG